MAAICSADGLDQRKLNKFGCVPYSLDAFGASFISRKGPNISQLAARRPGLELHKSYAMILLTKKIRQRLIQINTTLDHGVYVHV
jgi:hypothetical protein